MRVIYTAVGLFLTGHPMLHVNAMAGTKEHLVVGEKGKLMRGCEGT